MTAAIPEHRRKVPFIKNNCILLPYRVRRLTGLIAVLVLSCVVWGAEGLSTSFADVRIANVPLGQTISVRELGGGDLVLQNTGDHPMEIRVDAIVPTAEELRKNATPIPDARWIQFDPQTMTIEARHSMTCRVIITVPHEKKFAARTYQVMIWSQGHPLATHGVSIGSGLLSRLRFTTQSW